MSRFKNDWDKVLAPIFKHSKSKELSSFLQKERSEQVIYPESENVFNAFNYCPFSDVKVVIISQDPYYTPEMALGYAFGVPSTTPPNKVPPSLKTIISEVERSYGKFQGDISLINWVKQGVLLLNTALTVRKGEPGSHAKEWTWFTEEVIKSFESTTGIVFLLWGKHAQRYDKFINPMKHNILYAGHPSPLNSSKDKFIGCGHFIKTNEILADYGKHEIEW